MQGLSERKRTSNEKVIEQIILEQYNQYYQLAYSYVHNEADAGDIVQSGAYKALRSSHTLRNPKYAKTWVHRIMLNEVFNHLSQPKLESYESLQEERGNESEHTQDSYSDIDLQRALDALPSQEKAIVIMRYFEDKKLDEIADILEINVSTVKSKLYRSMEKLRVKLSDESTAIGMGGLV
ncbi:MAG: sigma-70 family RNA polymerase sigma factor [Lachnospiraceae bacterium]|nr:sigma-70 family RNA polymerase sigma factor [Lachnospiraceae bacterium]